MRVELLVMAVIRVTSAIKSVQDQTLLPILTVAVKETELTITIRMAILIVVAETWAVLVVMGGSVLVILQILVVRPTVVIPTGRHAAVEGAVQAGETGGPVQ